jgi:hypothetical protein
MVGLKTNKCCCDCYTFLDTFTRSNSTDVGPDWQECTGDWQIFNNALLGYDRGIITLLQMVGNPYGILRTNVRAVEEAVFQIFIYRGLQESPCEDNDLYFAQYDVGTGGSGFISVFRGEEELERVEVFSPADQVSFGVCIDVDGIAVEFEGKRLYQVCLDVEEDNDLTGYWFALGNGGVEGSDNIPTEWQSVFYSDHFDHNRRCPKCQPSCCFPNVNRTVAGFYITIDGIISNDCTCPPGYQTFLPINDLNAVCNCETVGGAVQIEYPNTGGFPCSVMDLQWSFSCSEVTGQKTFGLTIQPGVGTDVTWGFVFLDGTLPEDVKFDNLPVSDAGDGLVCDFSAATLTIVPFVTEGCCGGIPEDEINVIEMVSFCFGRSLVTGNLTPVVDVVDISGGVSGVTSSVSGTLSALGNIEGLSTASSKITGRLFGDFDILGEVSARSSLTGSLAALGTFSGEVTGSSFLEGDLGALTSTSGGVTGSSFLEGTLGSLSSAQGSVVGASFVEGALSSLSSAQGSVTGSSVVEGVLSAFASAVGTSKATSTLTGRLDGDTGIAGEVQSTSSLSGSLSATAFASSSVSGSSFLQGLITSIQNRTGEVVAASFLQGVLTQLASLSGSVSGTSSVAATWSALGSVTGAAKASSVLTGRLDGDTEISGDITGTSTLEGSLSATGNVSGSSESTSVVEGTWSAIANISGGVSAVSKLTGALESCCCGDCIVFRYTISGLANAACDSCGDYNTDNDSPPVNPGEGCVYSAQWESSDCSGQKLVFIAELICDDDGDIRLSGSIQDTALLEPLIDPPGGPGGPGDPGGPGNGPTPTNDIMKGTDTFESGTPCTDLEITLSRDTGGQTTCDFDSATVVLKVVDCPENQAVIEKIKKKAKGKKKRPPKKRIQLPVCQHLGEELGLADCGCGGKPMIYHCNLLNKPCMKTSVSKPVSRVGDKRISRPQVCSLCDHFEAKGSPRFGR